MSSIGLRDLRHSYLRDPATDADWALKHIDIDWSDGGAYALLGPSGCGKTTLLNIVSGLIAPTEGRVFFGEDDVTDIPPDQRNIAQVFQFPVVYDTMTVYDNLAFPLLNRRVPKAEIDAKVREIAKMLDLEDRLAKRASGLTADGKQKISLGRGLVRSDVNVIMFDEPLTVIDQRLRWRPWQYAVYWVGCFWERMWRPLRRLSIFKSSSAAPRGMRSRRARPPIGSSTISRVRTPKSIAIEA